MTTQLVDFAQGAPVPGDLDVQWIHGVPRGAADSEPAVQVHRYEEHTYVLRQSKAVNYEAPFLFLLLGNERALLLDTGATADPARFPLRKTVDGLLDGWLAAHPRDDYELVVGHTHAHGDHVAADSQFADRPATTVVGHRPDDVQRFFGFRDWPDEVVPFDLGGRVVDVTGIPGHHAASIAVHDPWTGILLTGDTVYRGRLYVSDYPAFLASLDRLVAMAEGHPVSHVLGCHIEMTRRPRRDFALGSTYQPDEPPLQMTVDQLVAVRDAARSVADRAGAHYFDDFAIFHGPCRWAMTKQVVRGWWARRRG